jgi:hypothetical protein
MGMLYLYFYHTRQFLKKEAKFLVWSLLSTLRCQELSYLICQRLNSGTGLPRMGVLFVSYFFGGICTSEPQGCFSYGNIYDKHYTRNVLSARDADLERASWAWSRCGEPSHIPRKRIPFPLPNAAHFGFSLALSTTLAQPRHLRTMERERITSIRDWLISSSCYLFSRFKERLWLTFITIT